MMKLSELRQQSLSVFRKVKRKAIASQGSQGAMSVIRSAIAIGSSSRVKKGQVELEILSSKCYHLTRNRPVFLFNFRDLWQV